MKKRSFSLVLLTAGWLCVAGCSGPATTATAPVTVPPTYPQAEIIGGSEIQAGEVEYGLQRIYPFKIKNTGTAPLTLKATYNSCHFAVSEVPETIAPNGEGEIKIRWAPIPGSIATSVGPYNITLKVQTNEPRELTFQVKAIIRSKIRVSLPENLSYIDFGDKPLQPGEVYSRDFKVFSLDLPSFNLFPTCSVEGIDVVKTKLPPDSRIGDTVIRSGYVVSLSTSPKLAPGYIYGEVALTITAEGEPERKIVLDLYANRENSEFGVSPGQIAFKKLKITDEDSKEVLIQFTSPKGDEKLELVSFEPKWLKVSAPERRGDKGGWKVTVSIPPNNAEAQANQAFDEMDGQIVLKSNKTDAPVAVRVKWRPEK